MRYPHLLLLLPLVLCGCLSKRQDSAPVVTYGVTPGAGSTGMHTILDGDTVYTVSKQYNLPIRDIITVNAMSAPYTLSSGYRLKLPPPNEYRVKPGDSVQSISATFDTSVFQLARLNNLNAPYALSAGQVLRLPSPQPQPRVMPEEPETLSPPVQVTGVERQALPPIPSARANANPVITQKTSSSAPVPPSSPVRAEPVSAASAPAKMPKTPPRADTGKFMWPVDGHIISGYGPKSGGLHNDGINIKAPKGTPVRSAENGVVVYAGNKLEGYGNLVLVRHQDKWMTAYAHLDKTLIKKGDVVKRGQAIGTVGATGQVDSPQLHFEIRKGTTAVNPDKYL
ncbi:MAG: LysM peptidoglycan-binding domain-containing M23 family metallopeptidase [Alphaproteobacteria bacterium]|nr:LysM peptidoglycan-binding domain-containing M23 family metallopeptidase [Alphaproteobacteria bacterium]